MNTITTSGSNLRASVCLALMLACLGFASASSAQEILAGASTGTIQAVRQDDGFLIISGTSYRFENRESQVYLRGRVVDSATLDEGMVVRYTLNNRGVLVRIEIIGPAAKLKILDDI